MKIFACTFLVIAGLGVSWAPAAGGPYRELSAEEKAKLDAVLPEKAPAAAAKPRKLLIYDANVGYGGHGSIPFANYVHAMGERTGPSPRWSPGDPAVFDRQNRSADAVCLNNTVGNLFTDAGLRRNLLEFVLAAAACWASTERPSPSLISQGAMRDLARVRVDDRRLRCPPGRGRTRRHRSTRPAIRSTGPSAAGGSSTRASSRVRDPYSRDRAHVP